MKATISNLGYDDYGFINHIWVNTLVLENYTVPVLPKTYPRGYFAIGEKVDIDMEGTISKEVHRSTFTKVPAETPTLTVRNSIGSTYRAIRFGDTVGDVLFSLSGWHDMRALIGQFGWEHVAKLIDEALK